MLAGVTPDEALERLLEGSRRYAGGAPEAPHRDAGRRKQQAKGQTPFAVILGCADSRVPPEIVFDQGIGDLFDVRVAGNTAADDVTIGSIEFGLRVLGCPLLVVLGHEQCGAVKAALDPSSVSGAVAALLPPILPAVAAARTRDDVVAAAVRGNVHNQVAALRQTFPDVTVVGLVYDLHTGQVELLTR